MCVCVCVCVFMCVYVCVCRGVILKTFDTYKAAFYHSRYDTLTNKKKHIKTINLKNSDYLKNKNFSLLMCCVMKSMSVFNVDLERVII